LLLLRRLLAFPEMRRLPLRDAGGPVNVVMAGRGQLVMPQASAAAVVMMVIVVVSAVHGGPQ
jgi:hypothetical protein